MYLVLLPCFSLTVKKKSESSISQFEELKRTTNKRKGKLERERSKVEQLEKGCENENRIEKDNP